MDKTSSRLDPELNPDPGGLPRAPEKFFREGHSGVMERAKL